MDAVINQILQNPLFLKLKNVVENGPYHNHENVYSHVIQVKNTAEKEINGDFITDPEAKKKFIEFTRGEIYGFKRRDFMILTALIHDIGKILTVKENGKEHPILVTNENGQTFCPGHEYWGSTIAGKLLEESGLSPDAVVYIAKIIANHDTFNTAYFESKANLSFDLLINDVKSRAEGLYIEAMFNHYCDCFTADVFQSTKEKIINLFNLPSLYERREYVIS